MSTVETAKTLTDAWRSHAPAVESRDAIPESTRILRPDLLAKSSGTGTAGVAADDVRTSTSSSAKLPCYLHK